MSLELGLGAFLVLDSDRAGDEALVWTGRRWSSLTRGARDLDVKVSQVPWWPQSVSLKRKVGGAQKIQTMRKTVARSRLQPHTLPCS